MSSKDDRSINKRQKMKQHQKQHYNATKNAYHNTSSSSQQSNVRYGVFDLVDSSDEPRNVRHKDWSVRNPPKQKNRDRLNLDNGDLGYNDNTNENGADFRLLTLKKPAIGGNYFTFKHEKDWDTQTIIPTDTEIATEPMIRKPKFEIKNTYFTLSIKLLSAGLETIPFYKRMEYPSTMFTSEQIKKMNKAAEMAETKYQEIADQWNFHPTIEIKTLPSSEPEKHIEIESKKIEEPKDELDELLDITTQQIAKFAVQAQLLPKSADQESTTVENTDEDDLQNWLDNI